MNPSDMLDCSRTNGRGSPRPPPLMCNTGEGRRLNPPQWIDSDSANTTHYDMAANRAYETPRRYDGIIQSGSVHTSTGACLSDGTSPVDRCLLPASALHADCEKLEKSNRRMKIIFAILVVLCVFAIVIYLGVIIHLFVVLSKMGPDQSASLSSSRDPPVKSEGLTGSPSGRKAESCVHENEIKEFKKIWDPEDQKEIMDLWKGIGFVYTSETGTYCFLTLQWVPQIMGKINSRVQESVAYIEKQQKEINETVHVYTAVNSSNSRCPHTGEDNSRKGDPTNPSASVYAHFFLDTSVDYTNTEEAITTVQWIKEGIKMSSRNRVDVSSQSGKFTIRHSGFYFLYTHMVFKDDHSEKVHRVVKTRDGHISKLLESSQGPTSFLQGVFMLNTNDTLFVNATARHLDRSRDKTSYFGAYLIRT